MTTLRELIAAATPGPWEVIAETEIYDENDKRASLMNHSGEEYDNARANAALIVALANASPAIADLIETARNHACDRHISQEGTTRWCRMCEALAKLEGL
jgi:hypothetical protein